MTLYPAGDIYFSFHLSIREYSLLRDNLDDLDNYTSLDVSAKKLSLLMDPLVGWEEGGTLSNLLIFYSSTIL